MGAARNYTRYYGDVFTGWEGDFLEAFRNSGVIVAACAVAHVSMSTVLRRRKAEPEFNQAVEEAREEAIERMEAALVARARDGVTRTKGVYHNGKKIADETITEYSDGLLKFYLEHNSARYKPSVDHNHKISILVEEARRLAKQEGLDEDALIEEAMRIVNSTRG